MESECIPFGESEKAYFKFADLNKSRNISRPYIPMNDAEYIQYKGDKRKHKFYKPKHPNEIRILGVDVGLMGGRENDQTVFTFIRCIPHDDEYIKSVEYIETMEGQHSAIQALRLKQIFYDLECDWCVMDTQGNSISIYEECTKITVDDARGIEYNAWASLNDEKMQNRAYDKNAVPCIYSIKVAGATGRQVNHEMATFTKTQFEKNKIKLLCNEIEGNEYILDKKFTDDEKARLIAVYFQTSRLIFEMINLEMKAEGGFIKLVEPSGHRKDRYSSLSYSLYYIKELEIDLRNEDEDAFELLKKYTFI